MILAQHGSLGKLNHGDFEVFLIVGDSNADGRGEFIPKCHPDCLYLWNGSGIDEVRSQSVSNDDNTKGSMWQEFARVYKQEFGKRVLLVQKGSGGSEFYPNGDNNNWYTSGTLYTPAKDAALAAQTFVGASRVNVIVCLGINDARGATTIANITLGIESLRTRLNSDLSTPQIYYIVPGREETDFNNPDLQGTRRLILNIALDTNGHVASCMLPYYNWGYYQVDNLHLTQAGLDVMGRRLVSYMKNSSYSKSTRARIAAMKDEPTPAQKTAIENFMNFFASVDGTLDGLHIYVASTVENAAIDWALIGAPDLNGVAFTAYTGITTNGTSNYVKTGFVQFGGNRSTNTDFAEFVKTGTVTSTGAAYLFGSEATHLKRLYQVTSALHAQAYDATDNSNATEATFASNAIYAIARNGTNKMMKKNGSNVISVTQAATGTITTRDTWVGTSNQNGTPATAYMNAQYQCWGFIQLSDVVWSDFVTALNTLLTAMATP